MWMHEPGGLRARDEGGHPWIYEQHARYRRVTAFCLTRSLSSESSAKETLRRRSEMNPIDTWKEVFLALQTVAVCIVSFVLFTLLRPREGLRWSLGHDRSIFRHRERLVLWATKVARTF